MKAGQITYSSYELSLKTPLLTARGPLSMRRGFLIAVWQDEVNFSLSEAAIFPEYGTETFESCHYELSDKKARNSLEKADENYLKELEKRCPALVFAVDCARRQITETAKPIAVNALLSGKSDDKIFESANLAAKKGYRTFKVKVGLRELAEEIELLKSLREVFADIAIRVDANNVWTLEQATLFCKKTENLELEYIEDPLRDIQELKSLRRVSENIIAVDEGARRVSDIKALLQERVCDVLVLKPSAIGSFKTLSQIYRLAQLQNVEIVISSLFESSIGLNYLTYCADLFGSPHRAHGLATAEFLQSDTLKVQLIPQNGKLTYLKSGDLTELLREEIDINDNE